MKKYKEGNITSNGNLFICTSEKEIELVGTLDNKGIPHTSNQVPECIAKAVRMAIEKEVGTEWQNELIQQRCP